MRLIRNIALVLLVGMTGSAFAQINILNAKKPQDMYAPADSSLSVQEQYVAKPMEYGYLDDRDIMWSTITWEKIDLRQKLNFPLYFPTESGTTDRQGLFEVLMDAIMNEEITEIYSDDYFISKMSSEEVKEFLYYEEDKVDDDGNEYTSTSTLDGTDIKEYRIKGMWYFDKRNGEMRFRLLAIAPTGRNAEGKMSDDSDSYPLFWIWYPDAREVLHEAMVFNPENSSFPVSFDDLFNARRFSSVIYKEDNVYGDREIEAYIKGNASFQLMEADRIKEQIRGFEMDLWSF